MKNIDEIRKNAEKLREEIEYHNYLYYTKSSPEIADEEFDKKLRELKDLEKEYPEIADENSPTMRVGEKPVDFLPSIKHSKKMYSLDNTYNFDEVKEFFKRTKKVFPEEKLNFCAELKMDGSAASLIYKSGKLVNAITRGDGMTGNVIIHSAKTIKNIPLKIKNKKDLEIRGEIYLPRSEFERLNEVKKEKGEEPFANPRNAAAGSLQILDPKIVSKRNLRFLPWELIGEEKSTHSESMEYLHKELFFDLNPGLITFEKISDLEKHFNKLLKKRSTFDFDFDGLVIKVDDFSKQKLLGFTSKFPRYSVALKFPAIQKTTKVREIQVSVGRTGAFTPVAILEPVELDGATVSRASLYNEDEIERLKIKSGDMVIVERAGDVIPKVRKVVQSGNGKNFVFPKKCPVCNSLGVKEKGEIVRRCINSSCPAIVRESILHFISRDGMNIKTLGEKHVDQMLNKKLISSFADLYFLKKWEIATLERMAEKSAQNILDELDKSKKRNLDKLIYSLGIRFVGTRAAEILADKFKSLDNLAKTNFEELSEIHEIGEKTARSVVEYFKNEENLKLLEKLREAGISFNTLEEAVSKKIFDGESFVFTGTLSVSRERAQTLVKNLGARPISALSKNTDFLVAGENPGSKIEKAEKLGVKVLDEKEFVDIVGKENFDEIREGVEKEKDGDRRQSLF